MSQAVPVRDEVVLGAACREGVLENEVFSRTFSQGGGGCVCAPASASRLSRCRLGPLPPPTWRPRAAAPSTATPFTSPSRPRAPLSVSGAAG